MKEEERQIAAENSSNEEFSMDDSMDDSFDFSTPCKTTQFHLYSTDPVNKTEDWLIIRPHFYSIFLFFILFYFNLIFF